jgi:arylsulfatase A-like enzyme
LRSVGASAAGLVLAAAVAFAAPALAAVACCPGDCDGDGQVTIAELVSAVGVALGSAPLAQCRAAAGRDGQVGVDALVQAVESALGGCAASRPNVLLVNLDDARADGIDRMPALDRLAAAGTRFTQSFTADALCAPSRASLFTGLYALHHGTRTAAPPLGGAGVFRAGGADQQTLAVWLRGAGYETGLFGKYLNEYRGTEAGAGRDGAFYVPPGWSRWRAFVSPEHYGGAGGASYAIVDEHGSVTDYDAHATDAQYSTDVTAAALREFIADAAAHRRPFLAVWTPFAPHIETPMLFPVPAARHLGVFEALPPWRPPNWDEADVSDKPRWLQSAPRDLFGVTDLTRQRAYEALLAVDEQLDRTLSLLADLGVERDTLVIVTSDNGVGWNEHRWAAQQKECPYEECLRVPLVIRYPGVARCAPAAVEAPALNIDIAPTVAELAGIAVPAPIDGRSLVPWLRGERPDGWRTDFLVEHWRPQRGDSLGYTGQVRDGDRLWLLHGAPRLPTVFEFDADGDAAADAVAVPIGATPDDSFAALARLASAELPELRVVARPEFGRVDAIDRAPSTTGVYWWVEVDRGRVLQPATPLPDYLGVRDVAGAATYVEYETGERELYDLTVDPYQLDNRAADPAYVETLARLAARLRELKN